MQSARHGFEPDGYGLRYSFQDAAVPFQIPKWIISNFRAKFLRGDFSFDFAWSRLKKPDVPQIFGVRGLDGCSFDVPRLIKHQRIVDNLSILPAK